MNTPQCIHLVDICTKMTIKKNHLGTSLVAQWLRLWAPNAEGLGSIPGQGTGSHMPQLRVHMLQLRPGVAK